MHWRSVVPFRDFQFYSDSHVVPKRHNFDVCQCRQCLALFTNPCLTSYGYEALADEAGQSYGVSSGRFGEQIQWMAERDLLTHGTTLLDVGCGDGGFILKLSDTLRRIGVDIDRPSIERALAVRGTANVEFHTADFERFRLEEKVDVITGFHVLEHLPSPGGVLQNLRAMASAGTRLLVEVPILELGATNDVCGFFSAWHMTHFSQASLENLVEASGWQIEESDVQTDHNGCRVIAVAGSSRARVTDTSQDGRLLDRYLADWYAALDTVEARILAIDSQSPLVIWGGGLHLEFLHQFTSLFREGDTRVCLVVDSDGRKQGKTWRGIPILAPDIVKSLDWDKARLLVSTYGGQGAVVAAARKLGVPETSIVTLYETIRQR
jgi:SAM-dependent methyltransferase